MISSLTSALGGVKHALGIVEVAIDAKKAIDVASVKVELLSTLAKVCGDLAEANMAQSVLADELRQAKETIARNDAWARDAQRYVLTPAGPDAYCYTLKPDATGEEPPHRLCQQCYQDQRKSVLQFNRTEAGHRVLVCHHCKAELRIPRTDGGDHVMTVPRASSLNFGGY